MDNGHDTPLILTEEYANKIAKGIAEGILEYCNVEKKEEVKTETKQNIEQENKKIDVKYQSFTNKWLPDVLNTQDHAGIFGQAISGFRGNTVRK